MRNGRDFAAQSDPGRNPQFGRTWTEPPRCSTLKTPKAASARAIAEQRFRRRFSQLRQLGGRSGGEV